MRRGLLAAVLVVIATLPALAVGDTPLIIEHVTVIDGTGRPPGRDMTVVIADGRFESVTDAREATAAGGTRIDGRGRFLIPGLMDMHVHLRAPPGAQKPEDRHTLPTGAAALHSYLYCGVTSIFDAGNDPQFVFGLRDAERGGRLLSPRIFAAGSLVTRPGSHGAGNGAIEIEEWSQGRPALDALLDRRPDLLKLVLDERGWGTRPLVPALDVAMVRRIVEHANDRGVRTVIHVSSELRAREAIFAGVDSLAHPVIQGPVSKEFVELMRVKRVPTVTTLTIGEGYSRLVDDPGFLDQALYRSTLGADMIHQLRTRQRVEWSANRWTQWMKVMTPIAQDNLRRLHDNGAMLVLGTDQSIGPAVHRELELLEAAGIPRLAILQIATLNAARFLGLERSLGSIEAGKFADAVLLDADPLAGIRNAAQIALVIKDGKIVDDSRLELAGGPVPRRYAQ